jgi:hypothetical protein
MSLYRCCFLGRANDVFQMQSMACEDDAQAIMMARRMSANSGADVFELWKDERCVHVETQQAASQDRRSWIRLERSSIRFNWSWAWRINFCNTRDVSS